MEGDATLNLSSLTPIISRRYRRKTPSRSGEMGLQSRLSTFYLQLKPMKSSTASNSIPDWQNEVATKPRKIRPDSRLQMLTPVQQKEIRNYAHNHTLAETVKWLKSNGVVETSIWPLSKFLSAYIKNESTLLLDLVIESNQPLHLVLRNEAGQLKLQILKPGETPK
ncbi:MAG: hypothetical protein WDN00_00430 [Limisphaerales bacterium]